MSTRTLLVALHDVTPAHRARLEQAERLLLGLGVSHVTYLLVPDFHGRARADASADFIAWCRAPRPFEVQWFLHGYFHDERRDGTERLYRPTMAARLAATCMTGGEAECLGLGPDALRGRIRAGADIFAACTGVPPGGFVAPAWLFNRHLVVVLKDLGFEFTESQFRILHVRSGRELVTPVMTWATRTRLRRYGSLVAAAVGRRLWQDRPVVRVALHPHDFDHPATVASISRALDAVRRNRVVTRYDAALFAS